MFFVSNLICLVNKVDEDVLTSLPLSRSTHHPQIRLKEFQYHSLEEKDIGHETTLKDSGIDTASSSTILNVLSTDPYRQVFTIYADYGNLCGNYCCASCRFCLVNYRCLRLMFIIRRQTIQLFLANNNLAFQ